MRRIVVGILFVMLLFLNLWGCEAITNQKAKEENQALKLTLQEKQKEYMDIQRFIRELPGEVKSNREMKSELQKLKAEKKKLSDKVKALKEGGKMK